MESKWSKDDSEWCKNLNSESSLKNGKLYLPLKKYSVEPKFDSENDVISTCQNVVIPFSHIKNATEILDNNETNITLVFVAIDSKAEHVYIYKVGSFRKCDVEREGALFVSLMFQIQEIPDINEVAFPAGLLHRRNDIAPQEMQGSRIVEIGRAYFKFFRDPSCFDDENESVLLNINATPEETNFIQRFLINLYCNDEARLFYICKSLTTLLTKMIPEEGPKRRLFLEQCRLGIPGYENAINETVLINIFVEEITFYSNQCKLLRHRNHLLDAMASFLPN